MGSTLAAAVLAVVSGVTEGLPWWAVVAGSVAIAGLAVCTGVRIAGREDVRSAALEPGENVLGTYTVRPPYTAHVPPSMHEGPQYQLRLTSHGLQMWERSVLLWRHPWPEVRVTVDGPRLRVHHQGREAGVMLMEHPGAVQEIRLAARRYGAA
ncbi:hypothetical protein OG625_13850 [Streptomyces sp. NBC_01351]|uniref:hypothetical protein n=1 Tax=Streptomyces sp. NBC_01351 TaxID=2903833 RepID=UPI002E340645|nr:hypothetical protein [Streptomyces sp. NBC_01351]